MSNNNDFNQLEDFLESESFVSWVNSGQDASGFFWSEWIQNNPGKKELVDEAIMLIQGVEFSPLEISGSQIDRALGRLNRNIDQRKSTSQKSKGKGGQNRLPYYLIAASVLIILTVGLWFHFGSHINMVTYSTGYAEWKTITLPDGSVVKLNANSTLRHLKNWESQRVRMVWLEGEAFFDVQKMMDLDREFKVITKDLGVEVLGTSFNVHARGQQTRVFLEEGKVKLNLGEDITYLEPGDLVVYSGSQSKVLDRRKKDEEMEDPSSWTNGVITLKDAYAFDIFKRLEEIYGLEIRVKNEDVYKEKFLVQLPMEELKIVIPILERSMKVKITQIENTLYLE